MRRKKSLEGIVKGNKKPNHVKHFDPTEAIHHHIVLILFISMMFLFSLVLFFTSEPMPESAVSYAIYEFQPITIHKDIGAGVSEFIYNVRHSEDRPLVLLTLYTFWIVIFGLVNMALYEKSIHKEHKKR